jgi:hypothetical protein
VEEGREEEGLDVVAGGRTPTEEPIEENFFSTRQEGSFCASCTGAGGVKFTGSQPSVHTAITCRR